MSWRAKAWLAVNNLEMEGCGGLHLVFHYIHPLILDSLFSSKKMLASLSVLVSLAVLPFVNAQADNNLGVKAIEAHFDQSHITEDYLDDFAPVATLDLNFEGVGATTPGQRLSAAGTFISVLALRQLLTLSLYGLRVPPSTCCHRHPRQLERDPRRPLHHCHVRHQHRW
jgi:hypothetical protein